MPNVRVHKPNGMLFFDFRFEGERCREYTALADTSVNRKKMEKVLARIQAEIKAGTFDYAAYFPNSKALERLTKIKAQKPLEATQTYVAAASAVIGGAKDAPESEAVGETFGIFATQWIQDHSIEWRRSHIRSLLSTVNGRLIPHFGNRVVSSITKSDILSYRSTLAKEPGRGDKPGLSAKRINEIMGTLKQILAEAADRHEFTSPMQNVKRLRVRKTDVQPFSLEQVQRILATVRVDYKDYLTVRFFTGMRTGEVNGLKWKYVDFERRLLLVRETFVLGEDEYTKTDGSQREIQMSEPVYQALLRQKEQTFGHSPYVFCNMMGEPLDNTNFTKRVWYPLLRHLDYEERRPYQMRHTAATLWLASGEAPEWIARQLGHTNTEMLFTTYSRYVPNLTRQDGSAMERLLASQTRIGTLLAANRTFNPTGLNVPTSQVQGPKGQPGSPDNPGGGGTGPGVFMLVEEMPPMPTPKPRGIPGRRLQPPGITDCPSASRHAQRGGGMNNMHAMHAVHKRNVV